MQTRQPRIESALDVVEGEIDVVLAEKRAFEAFLSRVAACETGTGSAETALATGTRDVGIDRYREDGTLASMDRVRTAYRETVMVVPHYETDYGDSLAHSVRVEFGPDVAELVTQETHLSPVAKAALLDAGREAKADRVRFLGLLRRERTSLREVRDELDQVETRVTRIQADVDGRRVGGIDGDEAELRSLLDRCESLADRRQETIHDRAVESLSGVDADSLASHLYADLDSTCPALSDVADCVETIHHALDWER